MSSPLPGGSPLRKPNYARRRVVAAFSVGVGVAALVVAGATVLVNASAGQSPAASAQGAVAPVVPGTPGASTPVGSAGSSNEPGSAASAGSVPVSPQPVSPQPVSPLPASPLPASAAGTASSTSSSASPPPFDKAALSIDDPNSIWVVVNKQRPLRDAETFVPPGLTDLPSSIPDPHGHPLRQETVDALVAMAAADRAEAGSQLVAQSGYRTYGGQDYAYQLYVQSDGVAGADKTSARAGYSEHQTGLAVDILDRTSGCTVDGPCFGDSVTGRWLAANAYRFGFVLRYPADKTAVTGYEYEPWHFRYVGVDLATEMHTTGVSTLEEFFGLPAAPDYLG